MPGRTGAFTRTLIRYPSDGLTISGFMDVPRGDGPFPVIIALHGYVDPSVYTTLDYTTRYADALASAGYFVLHPNLRSFPASDDGQDLFRVGMATDVLNLIAILKDAGGKPGPLQKADATHIGMWGHSMGGGITTRRHHGQPRYQGRGPLFGHERRREEELRDDRRLVQRAARQ